jgi:hypothetical protein
VACSGPAMLARNAKAAVKTDGNVMLEISTQDLKRQR